MKKVIPFVLLCVGILVVIAVYFLVIRKDDSPEEMVEEEEIALIEVGLPDRPVATLTPRSDGHWLDMEITKLGKFDAESVDYELVYVLPDGRTQGTGGMVRLKGNDSVEKEILLGTESSGNYYYDEGVESGKLTLRFRNEKGKLLVKFVSDFTLADDLEEANSFDGDFTFVFEEENPNFFVVMPTIGYPGDEMPVASDESPYGVFSSSKKEVPGAVDWGSSDIYKYEDEGWTMLEDGSSEDTGIFLTS